MNAITFGAAKLSCSPRDLIPGLSIEKIQSNVASDFDLSVDELLAFRRQPKYVTPRQIAMFLAYQHTRNGLKKIGKAFGNRRHTTVLHALTKIQALQARDYYLQVRIECIRSALVPEAAPMDCSPR